ncbi:sigma factor binding protein 2, chloroplastic-like [Cornus florida]|uniref:sigma factor binding protein 2, chloroplastic-like n=1 Tax=Cornus florida TaxID=4283 RepID=UPI0028A0B5F9|nr:sigma factor binding protein 2, chloroplastic-like [Cornus florida]
MDKSQCVHQKKATKQTKTKKKPVKVVYISNPMKVKTSASEFRALVQELTGQNADKPDPSRYVAIDDVADHQTVTDDEAIQVPTVDPGSNELPNRSDLPFEPYDDVFTPQMLENLTGLLPSSLLYESFSY